MCLKQPLSSDGLLSMDDIGFLLYMESQENVSKASSDDSSLQDD